MLRFVAHFNVRLLNTFDSALDFHILYYYMVTNYLNVSALETIVWCVCQMVFLNGI
jgi:hypothetical protein